MVPQVKALAVQAWWRRKAGTDSRKLYSDLWPPHNSAVAHVYMCTYIIHFKIIFKRFSLVVTANKIPDKKQMGVGGTQHDEKAWGPEQPCHRRLAESRKQDANALQVSFFSLSTQSKSPAQGPCCPCAGWSSLLRQGSCNHVTVTLQVSSECSGGLWI